MDLHLQPCRSEAVKWRILDEEGVLVHLESGTYFSLNPVGLFIWDRCSGDFTVAEIAAGITQEFDVSESVALRDLKAFLEALVEQDLIEFDDRSGSTRHPLTVSEWARIGSMRT